MLALTGPVIPDLIEARRRVMSIHPASLDFIADWNDAPATTVRPDRRYRRRALALW